jgi:putative glycosyltransferase (TIGR04372 family)
MRFTTTTVCLGARRIRVTLPNERQYGHLGLEIVMSLAHARQEGTDVYFVRPSTSLGTGLFELESPQVRVLRPPRVVRELFRTCISWRRLRDRIDGWRDEVREQVEREFVREATRYVANPGMPQQIRESLRGARRRLRASLEQAARDRRLGPPYYERRLLREPVPVRLHPAASEEAARQARAYGIAPDARLVCIHAREGGYKRGNEIQDTKPEVGRDDHTRNARVESYLQAVDYLVQRGYTVIRLGDPSMTPVHHPGVVDLATSPARTNLLEVYCLLRSDLIVAGESAYVNLICLTNTPILLVNVTEPISAYPIRAPGLFLPKTVVDKRTGQRLTSLDLLGLDYHHRLRDTRRYLYVDNSPEEILEATREMLEWLGGTWTECQAQHSYHDAIMSASARLRRSSSYVRKWGLHEGFLGDGRIARVAVGVDPTPTPSASPEDAWVRTATQ